MPETPASTSYAYIMAAIDMVQSVNENHLTTFNDLAVISDSETSSLTSWNARLALSSVTIVFDRYDNAVSIKTSERERRGSSSPLIPSDLRKQTSFELPQVLL